jgi:TonB family protein
MRRISLSHAESRRIRVIAVVASNVAHLLVVGIILFLQFRAPETMKVSDLDWRGGGGGGGGNLKLYEIEFGQQSGNQTKIMEDRITNPKFHIVPLKPNQRLADVGTPIIQQEKKKKKQKRQQEDALYGANLGIKHIRGQGPGAGGGMGGGTGGGIGKGSGPSIDWGGTGSRRLLSGKIPSYPQGTNKELPVALQFTVLPDGTVGRVIPLRKSDELLESAAIAALKTWRFDPLPSQVEQKDQVGKITFNFTLE